MPDQKLRILIADDSEVVREGIRLVIERQPGWEVCGVAATGHEAVDLAAKLEPAIVVMDIRMPEMDGLAAARQIRHDLPRTEILIFTAHKTDDLIREVFDAGAKSFIFKSDARTYLVDAIQSLAQHKPFFTSKVSEILFADRLNKAGADQTSPHLTLREREIVRLLAEGKSNKQVAQALGISIRTAETHRASIMRKLDVDSLANLVRYAIRNHMIDA
jgi:DNA-binding NarL/FixJ family response regulator